jgi:apolipoprotein D and lipocalin family protein
MPLRNMSLRTRPLRSRIARLLMSAALGATLAACASAPRTLPGPPLALRPLMGTWHVIAHVPYFTERGHVWAHDDYSLRPDGRIDVHYTYRTGFHAPVKTLAAVATVVPGSGNREWRLRFFHLVPATQQILEVAPDGRWMLLATPGRDLAWIFARDPVMDETTYQSLLQRLAGHGVNTDRVWRIAQTPEQVGGLGFERPNDE